MISQRALISLFALCLGASAQAQSDQEPDYAADGRQILYLTEEQRTHVQGEMQIFLAGLQSLTLAFAENDRDTIRDVALSLGPKGRQGDFSGANPGRGSGNGAGRNGIMRNAPAVFHNYSQSLRFGFLDIAQQAETADLKTLQSDFADNLATCSACHATFTARDAE